MSIYRYTLCRFTLPLGLILSTTAQACVTCGCSPSSDAALGFSAHSGWRVNVESNFINQNQLRSGTEPISATQAARINNAGGNQEVERDTISRYTNLGIGYSPSVNWNFNLLIPYIDRSHTTYSNATTSQLTPANISGSDSNGLGDIKLIGSYQGLLPTHNFGLQIGIKLPTGRYGGQDINTGATVGRNPVFFSSGSSASAGQALDASLQPGTGSTDLILGAYYYQALSQNFDVYANGQFQAAVAENLNLPGANYRPGNLASLSFGLRYEANPEWVPQLQVNITHKSHDQGALADTIGTGGTVAYLSPGMTLSLLSNIQVYGFVQLPVYSKLDGYQLFPRWTGTLGASYAF